MQAVLITIVSVIAMFVVGCAADVDDCSVQRGRYVLDEDTAKLKAEFEKEWLWHVSGYTNYTTAGMADDAADMRAFVSVWKPRILRNQAYKEQDRCMREMVVDRMLKANSIASLYYGLLVPHEELLDRWYAYDGNTNACGMLNGQRVQFVNARARWMHAEYENCEMSAVISEEYVWPRRGRDCFAFIFVDMSVNVDDVYHFQCSALHECWLGLFRQGHLVDAKKLPLNDVRWYPCADEAPFGRKYTLEIGSGKAKVVNCVTGHVIMSVEDVIDDSD